jgi:folate-binding protein YgfZ
MNLNQLYEHYGAVLAADGIPLHFGDVAAEYQAGLNAAILLVRSHEGRLRLTGADRHTFLNRMSTNQLLEMAPGEGRVTVFTNATARILDRVLVYNGDDHLLLITEPGRGEALANFLQRQIFFNDQVTIENTTAQTAQLALHGINADAIMDTLAPGITALNSLHGQTIKLNDATLFAARRKELSVQHWVLVMNQADAAVVYAAIMTAGQTQGLTPAGSLTYNALRIRAGYPAGRDISSDYLPLEAGLWDAVSFSKGCYTGQEIIARMESRARIARTLVSLDLTHFTEAPASIFMHGKLVGEMTSSVQAPDGQVYALAIVKIAAAKPGTALTIGEQDISAVVASLPGAQPPYLTFAEVAE